MMENCLLKYFLFNDELREVSEFNPTLLTEGPGIYEVLRVVEGKPLFLQEHLLRFFQSAVYENFLLNLDKTELKYRIRKIIEENELDNGNIRFQFIVHPVQGNLFLAWVLSNHYPGKDDMEYGVNIVTLNAIRENPQSKRTNLAARILAEHIINEQQIAEVLLINDDGTITEGSRSNIFFIENNKIITPDASLVLHGITRDKIIKLSRDNHIELIEEYIKVTDIDRFDACFLSSTSKNVLSIKQIDQHSFDAHSPVIHKISSLFVKHINQHLQNFRWLD